MCKINLSRLEIVDITFICLENLEKFIYLV
jgi:hypothetical protein